MPDYSGFARRRGIDMIDICTMTTAFNHRRDGSQISYPESIRRCKAAGFDVLDLNMCSMDRHDGNELAEEDWEERVEAIIEERDRQGVTFYQTHPPFRKGSIETFPDPKREKFYWDMVYRSLDVTARIGAKWAIIHAINDAEDPENIEVQLEKNHRHFDPVVEYASKLGIGIAFENMVQAKNAVHRFGSLPEEMNALADSFACDHVGICWDFGHGNTAIPARHPEGIRMMGSRLKCVHVDDNLGVIDDHFIPFRGNIRWEEVMPALKEIDFPGVIDLELSITGGLPDELKDEAVRFTASIARKLQELIYA